MLEPCLLQPCFHVAGCPIKCHRPRCRGKPWNILPPSEIPWRLFLAVLKGSEGKHLFHRIGWKGRIWQIWTGLSPCSSAALPHRAPLNAALETEISWILHESRDLGDTHEYFILHPLDNPVTLEISWILPQCHHYHYNPCSTNNIAGSNACSNNNNDNDNDNDTATTTTTTTTTNNNNNK